MGHDHTHKKRGDERSNLAIGYTIMEKDCIIISWGADTVIHLELDHIKERIIQ